MPAAAGPLDVGDVRGISQPPVPSLSAADIAPYLKTGTASVRGRLYAKLPGTRLLTFRNTHVYLEPAVDVAGWLTDEQIRIAQGAVHGASLPAATVALFHSAVRGDQTDDRGFFSFTGVPALSYIVVAAVEEREPRTGYDTTTNYVNALQFDPGIYGGYLPTVEPVTTTDSYGYTCTARGALYGFVQAVAGNDTSVALGLVAENNDGC